MDNDLLTLHRNWGLHGLCFDHPWVDTSALPTSIDELETFLQCLPEKTVYVRIPGGSPDAGELPRIDLFNHGELAERLQEGSVHVLGVNLQKVSGAFRHFQSAFLNRITPVLRRHGDIDSVQIATAVFISSANTVVPFHGDSEHNFLFQITGEKFFHIFPNDDLELFPSESRERLMCTRQCVLNYRDSYESKAEIFALSPGSATYQPPLAPHWVEAGNSVNVSVAVSVYTQSEERTRLLHVINHRLRQLRYTPSPVGKSRLHDGVKFLAARTLQHCKNILTCSKPVGHF